jgi:hypothetical protein
MERRIYPAREEMEEARVSQQKDMKRSALRFAIPLFWL